MKKFICSCLVILTLNPIALAFNHETLNKELIKNEEMNSIVSVEYIHEESISDMISLIETSYGTGFFIRNDLLVTAAHCVRNNNGTYGDSFRMKFLFYNESFSLSSTEWFDCKVIAKDYENDIVIASVDSQAWKYSEPLTIAKESLNRNDNYSIVGYNGFVDPYSDIDNLDNNPCKYLEESTASSTDSYGNTSIRKYNVFSGKAYFGMSGGPILNSNDEVIGLVSSTAIYNNIEKCYAIDVKHILKIIPPEPKVILPRGHVA